MRIGRDIGLYLCFFALIGVSSLAEQVEQELDAFDSLVIGNAVEAHLYMVDDGRTSYIRSENKTIFDTLDWQITENTCRLWQDDPLDQVLHIYLNQELSSLKVGEGSRVIIHHPDSLGDVCSIDLTKAELEGRLASQEIELSASERSLVDITLTQNTDLLDVYAQESSRILISGPYVESLIIFAEHQASVNTLALPALGVDLSAFYGAALSVCYPDFEGIMEWEREKLVLQESGGVITLSKVLGE